MSQDTRPGPRGGRRPASQGRFVASSFALATTAVLLFLVGSFSLSALDRGGPATQLLRASAPALVGLLVLVEVFVALGAWRLGLHIVAPPAALGLHDPAMHDLLDQVDEPVLLMQPDGSYIHANEAFAGLAGVPVGHLSSMDLRALLGGTAAQRSEQDLALRENRSWRGPTAIPMTGADPAVCAFQLSPVCGLDGTCAGIMAFGRPIAHAERVQAQLFAARHLEAIGHLAGGVAHDFNNLLTVIRGRASMLESELDPGSPMHGEVVAIQDMSMVGAALTSQLLAFSRRQALELTDVDMAMVVGDLVPMVARIVGEDVQLEHVREANPWLVRADGNQIGQVLLNLVVNARDAMPEGGTLHIETRNRIVALDRVPDLESIPPGDYVSLVVQDTGVGMAQPVLDRVFDPFFTTKPVGQGTGMGLAVIHGIVTQVGGFVQVQSAPGQGTRVELFLPRVVDPHEAAQPAPSDVGRQGGNERILVVEDDPDVQAVISSMLKAVGYTTYEAGDGVAALALLEALDTPPHLVLSDVVMPRMRGSELVRHLQRRYPELKVLLMSGYSEDAIMGQIPHSIKVLQKPVSAHTLRQAVRHALDT